MTLKSSQSPKGPVAESPKTKKRKEDQTPPQTNKTKRSRKKMTMTAKVEKVTVTVMTMLSKRNKVWLIMKKTPMMTNSFKSQNRRKATVARKKTSHPKVDRC